MNRKAASAAAAVLLLAAFAVGCGREREDPSIKAQNDPQGGAGNKLHKGDLHSK
ncbi:hypothetical protein [Paenibacillus flagellatus]|uniref:hypothetical protein n=1 Tax=Paenibacillus flagellatus TaxID=2211139 RepID=UPI00130516E0|nr:hypothetical protein [Paenibacillus flagellatus]